MCQAVRCIDEQAWAGTRFGPPAEQDAATPKVAVTIAMVTTMVVRDAKKNPANRTKLAGHRW